MDRREKSGPKESRTMIIIQHCGDQLDELINFVSRLNSDVKHHIGFFGEGDADVRSSLAECLIPPGDGFRMAYEGKRLVGIFGVDADPEVDRAWLFGPLVEHTDWVQIADQLYAEIVPLVPAGIHDYDIFCDEQNSSVADFALRHGFSLRSENAVMILERKNYHPTAKMNSEIIDYQENFFEQLKNIHRNLFPNAYFTARQMMEKQDQNHRLYLAVEHGQLLGYHFCKIEPESKSGYVDFIGTDLSARGRGLGADLLASGVDWILSAPSTMKISLTVNADNEAVRGLYQKFGFTTNRVMRGYRKRIS
jgi:ribosomal protein S18 acetylase RimI-like enzyme